MMVEHGTALVPTLINIENFPGFADAASKFPVYAAHTGTSIPGATRVWRPLVKQVCASMRAVTPEAPLRTAASPMRSRRSRPSG